MQGNDVLIICFLDSLQKLKRIVDDCINHFVSKFRNALTVQSGVLPVE